MEITYFFAGFIYNHGRMARMFLLLIVSLVALTLIYTYPDKPAKSGTADDEENVLDFQGSRNLNEKLANLKYPNSSVEKLEDHKLTLRSFDSPERIASWYKEKINSLGMSTTTSNIVVTNGNVANQLVGADLTGTIGVDITKGTNDKASKILVIYR